MKGQSPTTKDYISLLFFLIFTLENWTVGQLSAMFMKSNKHREGQTDGPNSLPGMEPWRRVKGKGSEKKAKDHCVSSGAQAMGRGRS